MRGRGLTAVVLAALVAGAGCGAGTDGSQEADAREAGGWQPLPDGPLSARYDSYAFGVGDEMVLIGGTTEPPCPPAADCSASGIKPLRDGAIYDFGTGRWRETAPAPVGLRWGRGAVVGSVVYVLPYGHEDGGEKDKPLLRYDVDADRWRSLPLPPVEQPDWLNLEAAGDRLLAYSGSHEQGFAPDYILDSVTDTWELLPRDPLAPSFDRQLAQVGNELVLLAQDLVDQPGSEKPSFTRAAALDRGSGEWRRLPDSEVLGGSWVAVGEHLVSPMDGGADGGETNPYGRTYPYGGILDPATGTWTELPRGPEATDGLPRQLHASRELALLGGRALDPVDGTWLKVPRLAAAPLGGIAESMVGARMVAWGGYHNYGYSGADPEFSSDGWFWVLPGDPS